MEVKSLIGGTRTCKLLQQLVSDLDGRFRAAPEDRATLANDAHAVAGPAGTLGFMRLSVLSREAEQASRSSRHLAVLRAQLREACDEAMERISAMQDAA
jgi:HPt (histidine-containing phosphotransfer) domain-containing protein